MFHYVAVKLSEFIVQRGDLQGVNKSKVRYGIEILLTGLAKITIILLVSILLGIFAEILMLMATFITLRLFSRGLHLSQYYRCVLLGLLLFLGSAYVASWLSVTIDTLSTIMIIIVTTVLAFISCWKFAPALFVYRKFTNEKKEKLR